MDLFAGIVFIKNELTHRKVVYKGVHVWTISTCGYVVGCDCGLVHRWHSFRPKLVDETQTVRLIIFNGQKLVVFVEILP